jgi:putative transposase
VRKVWRQMKREGFDVARCTVAADAAQMGLQGVIRGKPVRTTVSDKARLARSITSTASSGRRAECAVALGLHLCRTWQGFVYVAFVIDAYARRIVGWRGQPDGARRLRARCAGAGPP